VEVMLCPCRHLKVNIEFCGEKYVTQAINIRHETVVYSVPSVNG
jgi:hypothetical protein